jgi:hypothetical protein
VLQTALATGCGTQPPYGIVEGKVTAKGVPLPEVQVVFYPNPENGGSGPRSVALTDSQGVYRLKDDKGREGVVVGMCRVCINDARAIPHRRATPRGDNSSAVRQPSRVPSKYGDTTTTPFSDIEVKAGAPQSHDFDVGK